MDNSTSALIIFANFNALLIFYTIYNNSVTEIKRLNDQLQIEVSKRQTERSGRINLQTSIRNEIATNIDINGYNYYPIAKIESPFPDRRGTPRQPVLVPAAKGVIRFNKQFIQHEHFAELREFSHVWIVFVFHENTNVDKTYRNSKSSGSNENVPAAVSSSSCFNIASKVKPPRLKKRVGCLSTRSPHRPNNIGLSVCQILSVENDSIVIGGVDLVHGTPVLDIKPYIPYDSIRCLHVPNTYAEGSSSSASYLNQVLKVPDWIYESPVELLSVEFSDEATEELSRMEVDHEFMLCSDAQNARDLITQVLRQDIRSRHQGRIQRTARGTHNDDTTTTNSSNSSSSNSSSSDVVNSQPPSVYTCRLDNMLISFCTCDANHSMRTLHSTSSSSSSLAEEEGTVAAEEDKAYIQIQSIESAVKSNH